MSTACALTDERLAADARSDERAFAILYDRYVGPVYRYMRYQADPQDAHDLTSQVFLHAFRAAHQFRGDGASYRAWIFRIAHNTLASWRRATTRVPVLMADVPDRSDVRADPARSVTDRETGELVRAAVRDLPAADRELIELRYVEGMQPCEIAKVTGCSDVAVRVRIHRLLRRLRRRLEREEVLP